MKHLILFSLIYLFYFYQVFSMNPRIISLKLEDKVNMHELNFEKLKNNIVYRNIVVHKILRHYFETHLWENHSYLSGYLQEELVKVDSKKELMFMIIDLKKTENVMNVHFPEGTPCKCFKNLY